MVFYYILLIFGIYIFGFMILVHLLFSKIFFSRSRWKPSPFWPRYSNYQEYERIPIQFMSGKNRLNGFIYGGQNDKALIVFSHGLGSSAESYLPQIIWFVDKGYKAFSYDSTGTHSSEGKGTKGMAQSAFDLKAALFYIKNDPKLNIMPILLFGHSWGAYAAAAVLSKSDGLALDAKGKPPITAAICVSGYNTPNGIVWESSKKIISIFSILAYPFFVLENFFRFGKASMVSAAKCINNSQTPVLLVHGAGDTIVPFNRVSIISQYIANPQTEYYIRDSEGQNGHNDLFLSERAIKYAKDIKTKKLGEINPLLMGEVDQEFMTRLNSFYEKQLAIGRSANDPA